MNNSFEAWRDGYPFECPSSEGQTDLSPARATYWPSTESVDVILDELALLLTAGRLGETNRAIIKPAVEEAFNSGDVAKAVRIAQQLVSASPEFHSTNIVRQEGTGIPREVDGHQPLPPGAEEYKAVVVIMLVGGADSFNFLVPDTTAGYADYVKARGKRHAVPTANITALGNTGFGMNKVLSTVLDLYNKGEALWLANTGTLDHKMNNTHDYVKDTKARIHSHSLRVSHIFANNLQSLPPSLSHIQFQLYAHNTMQQ